MNQLLNHPNPDNKSAAINNHILATILGATDRVTVTVAALAVAVRVVVTVTVNAPSELGNSVGATMLVYPFAAQ